MTLTTFSPSRLMLDRPGSVTAIITQNGNAYLEGLGAFWDTLRAYWKDPEGQRESIRQLLTFESTISQVRCACCFLISH